MSVRPYAVPGFVLVAVTLFTVRCGESPTDPGGAVLGKGKPPTQSTKVTLENLALESSVLAIGGAAVNYTVDIVNAGKKRESMILQGEIGQLGSNGATSALRGAGGVTLECGSGAGILPHGTCSMSFTAQASNSTGGSGTLVAGSANLILRVIGPDGSQLAGITASITLVE